MTDPAASCHNLLSSIAGGNERSLELLYDLLFPKIQAYVHRRFDDLDDYDAQEVAQHTMRKIWETAGNYRGTNEASAWGYVWRIAVNKAKDMLRALRRRSENEILLSLAGKHAALHAESLDDLMIHRQDVAEAAHRLDSRLSHKERQAIWLFWNGMPMTEIAR